MFSCISSAASLTGNEERKVNLESREIIHAGMHETRFFTSTLVSEELQVPAKTVVRCDQV